MVNVENEKEENNTMTSDRIVGKNENTQNNIFYIIVEYKYIGVVTHRKMLESFISKD